MALVTTDDMLKKAKQGKYAIGAFNAENMEMLQAIIEAAEEAKSPVIIQTSTSTMGYADFAYYVKMLEVATKETDVPVALNFDHCMEFDHAMQALKAGYTSIMIDGSKRNFADNIAVTKQVVAPCKAVGIPVEAELGYVGGKEHDIDMGVEGYTNPQEALQFSNETGISSLAVSIGTQHGTYTAEPNLDIKRLKEISETIDIPLVLHGGSGLTISQLKQCIQNGISKVNFAAELREAYTQALKTSMQENEAIDPKVHGVLGKKKVKEIVKEKLEICGSIGKAIE